jgi:dolichol-phosphate mannosyltransferase
MMDDRLNVCVLIPTLNEAETIGTVVDGFRDHGYDNVLVIDGGSTDGTRDIATERGARVLTQTGTGKGQAVREAVRQIDAPYVLLVDGDSTYRPADAEQMLEPLLAGRAEHVIGNRFADMESGAMTRLNRVGNRMINTGFRYIHGRDFKDILSGYRAFTRESFRRLSLQADGFGIETEMAVECVKHSVSVEVVPIRYETRPGQSETNLHPIRDGGVILLTLYQMAKTNNPLFYFGSVGTLSTLVGLGLGTFVAVEWFTRSISHEVIAVVGAFTILFGVQLLMFGVLSDMIVAVNREQTRRLEEIAGRLAGGDVSRDDRPPGDKQIPARADGNTADAPGRDDVETADQTPPEGN